jgi:L-asparaginase
MTGALTPARFSESDAPFNLGMAFAAAQTAPPGVYIVMNGEVFPAGAVRKDREAARFVRAAPPEG